MSSTANRNSLPPLHSSAAQTVSATAADKEQIKQWIVYLIGAQPDGPLAGYVPPEPKQTSSMFGAFSSVSPSRGGRSPSVSGGAAPIMVSKTISTDVMKSLRLVGQDMSSLVKELTKRDATERSLTNRVRQGETIFESSPTQAPTALEKREPTVDVEDLDAFLLNADAARPPDAAGTAAAPSSSSAPPKVDAKEFVESVVSLLCPQPMTPICLTSPHTNGPRELGKSESDAYQMEHLTHSSAQKAVTKSLDAFLSYHNDALLQCFFEGGYKQGGNTALVAANPLLSATSPALLEKQIEGEVRPTMEGAAADMEQFRREVASLVEALADTDRAIAECETLSLRGALAIEMEKIEERLREAAARGSAAMKLLQGRLDAMRPVLDGPMPSSEEDGASLEGNNWGTALNPPPVPSPSSSTAKQPAPKEVLSALTNTLKTQVEPFAQRTADVFLQRATLIEDRPDEPSSPQEHVAAYQEARKQQLAQQTEDLKAALCTSERQLNGIRSIYDNRDLPAAQAEYNKWNQYATSLRSARDQLQKNLQQRIKYDEDTAGMRSHEREKLPPPPQRLRIALPSPPSDPRPNAAKGGLHNLPLTWKERYQKMPPAALLTAMPSELRSQAEIEEEARRKALEGDDEDVPQPPTTTTNVAADLVSECEALRKQLKEAMNRKKGRDQCHAALARQLATLSAQAAANEAKDLSPTKSMQSTQSYGGAGAGARDGADVIAAEARRSLGEVLRKYA